MDPAPAPFPEEEVGPAGSRRRLIVLDQEKVEKYARLCEQDRQYFNFPVSGLHR